jgi:hypothetical protein
MLGIITFDAKERRCGGLCGMPFWTREIIGEYVSPHDHAAREPGRLHGTYFSMSRGPNTVR